MKIKLIIADGSEVSRLGLKTMFQKSEEVEVVGEANSSAELVSLVGEFKPDVVLIDYGSKEFTIDIVPKIGLKNSAVGFVGITPYNSGKTIVSALKVGVDSHVKKDCSVTEVKNAVMATAKGEKFFCAELVELMRNENIDFEKIELDVIKEPGALSERELEIIKLIAEGYTNAQISVVLYISNHTVNTHRKNIMKKLGVNNTAGIVMFAVKSNLVSPNKFMFSPQNESN